MSESDLYRRYCDLKAYVGWTSEDAARISRYASCVEQQMDVLIDDFYAEIEKHSETLQLITGGKAQIDRLRGSLRGWLRESMEGRNDPDYITRRWNIGLRHATIGLNPAYTIAATSRLRSGVLALVAENQHDSLEQYVQLVGSFNKLFDLELTIIQDAYQAEYLKQVRLVEHERSEVKFRMLVEAAASVVIILRSDRSIAYLSPYSEELTGYSLGEIAGRDFLELFIPDSAKNEVAAQIEAMFGGHPAKAYEMPIIRRDGEPRWLVWNSQRLDDFDGSPAVLAVGQDFTERRDAQERLLRSERLAGIGQMITGLAHESRNALQRIQACGEMLELEVAGNEEAVRLVRRSQEAQDHLRRLFDEVRGYAAPIQLERTSCHLDAVWREAWNLLDTPRRGRRASLLENTRGADQLILADRFRLSQLFRNLFENSLAACSDPVLVQISCRDVQYQQQDSVEISIRDNGPGLSLEARRNVFEPFFTTKTKGTGLGMAIARRIIEAHGGEICVSNSSEAGAEFIVRLPRSFP